MGETMKTHDDLAGLVDYLREVSANARNAFAERFANAEYAGERPDLEPITAELTVERIEDAADAIEALAAPAVAVKQLVWRPIGSDGGIAADAFGVMGFYRIVGRQGDWTVICPKGAAMLHEDSIETQAAARRWAETNHAARILSAITLRPEAEVHAEAWAAAIEAIRTNAKTSLSAAWAADLIDIWCGSLSPPADISAALDRIKAEAKAEGMRDGLREALLIANSQEVRCAEWVVAGNGNPVASEQCAQIASDILAKIKEVCK